MKVQHTLTVVGTCPVDGSRDFYRCVVTTDRIIDVELILGKVGELTSDPIYQEDLTVELAVALQATVETTGGHSRVSTYCKHRGTA